MTEEEPRVEPADRDQPLQLLSPDSQAHCGHTTNHHTSKCKFELLPACQRISGSDHMHPSASVITNLNFVTGVQRTTPSLSSRSQHIKDNLVSANTPPSPASTASNSCSTFTSPRPIDTPPFSRSCAQPSVRRTDPSIHLHARNYMSLQAQTAGSSERALGEEADPYHARAAIHQARLQIHEQRSPAPAQVHPSPPKSTQIHANALFKATPEELGALQALLTLQSMKHASPQVPLTAAAPATEAAAAPPPPPTPTAAAAAAAATPTGAAASEAWSTGQPHMSKVQQCAAQILRVVAFHKEVHERALRICLGNNPDTSKALRLLMVEGKLYRKGAGGRGDPYTYRVTPAGLGCAAGAESGI